MTHHQINPKQSNMSDHQNVHICNFCATLVQNAKEFDIRFCKSILTILKKCEHLFLFP